MNIIIIGGGKVGYTLAENLAVENHNITIIDSDDNAVRKASDSLDVMCIRGNGASISILRSAGVESADVVIAASGRDELNMVCCLAAKKLGAKHTVARIRDVEYAREITQLQRELDIDVIVNPESATASQISRLLRFPDAADIETFYRGQVELIGFRVNGDDVIVGSPISSVMHKLRGVPVLFCAVERDGGILIPNGSTVLQSGDKVYVIGEIMGVVRFFEYLGRITPKIKDVFIIGGGRIAEYLSHLLSDMNIGVKIIECDAARCTALSEALPKALVVCGDGTEQELLSSENLSRAGAFVSLTGRDEDNIITSLFAIQSGVTKTVTKINHQSLPDIVRRLGLESTVSPKLITAYAILKFVRGLENLEGSRMTALYRIADGRAEAMEFAVSPNMKNLNVPLKNLRDKIKPGILVAVIVRDGRFIIPEGGDFMSVGDSVIIVSADETLTDVDDIFME